MDTSGATVLTPLCATAISSQNSMKLAVVFPVHNQHLLSEAVLDVAKANLSGEYDVQFLVIDNASDTPFIPSLTPLEKGTFKLTLVRLMKNIGVYPIFWEALKHIDSSYDIIAYLHSDVFVAEEGWDKRVIQAFEENPNLGLLGFIGSNEIDAAGGRGLGTTSNFMGNEYKKNIPHPEIPGESAVQTWFGSAAEIHGKRNEGYSKAAVVDGCVMIFRRMVFRTVSDGEKIDLPIPQRLDFPPHHFYDRLLSCEVAEAGWEVGVLGIGFDHISGQTVNQESSYSEMAAEWGMEHLLITSPDQYMTPAGPAHNWDTVLYTEAEGQWLHEYRDIKHFIPRSV